MAHRKKEESFWDGMLTLGGVLGLGWLMIETIKLFGTEEYRCPNCKTTIKKEDSKCPNCQASLTWKI